MGDGNPSAGSLEKAALEALAAGRADHARELLEQALALDPQSPGVHANLGVALQALGRLDEAIAAYGRATAIVDDQLGIIHFNRGTALAEAGRFDEAALAYREALRCKPAWAVALDNLGTVLQRLGRTPEAEQVYGEALAIDPEQPDARCNLGTLLVTSGRGREAEALFRQVLAGDPEFARGHAGLGAALIAQGHHREAVVPLRRAIDLDPALVDPYRQLADALSQLGELDEALAAAERAIELRPAEPYGHSLRGGVLLMLGRNQEGLAAYQTARELAPHLPEVHFNAGIAIEHTGDLEAAVACYREALAGDPDHVPALTGMASALSRLKRIDEAEAAYRRLLEVQPAHPAAPHMLAALRGEITATAPRRYVTTLFDGYARNFDEHMRGKLQYQGPALLHEALAGGQFHRALDLGCGTGLIGAVLRTWVDELHGIDLAPQMIEQARAKNLYDRLEVADIVDFLRASELTYDLVTAADVFCYIGDLSPVLAAVRAHLEPEGLLAFTTERYDDGDVCLLRSGRYAHSRGHLLALATAHGYDVLRCDPAEIRQETFDPVHGWLCVLRAA